MHTDTLLLLNLGQSFVETSWGQGQGETFGPGSAPPAGCYCILTGVAAAFKATKGMKEEHRKAAFEALHKALPSEAQHGSPIHDIAKYNDAEGRTKEEVIAVFLRSKSDA